MSEVPKFNKYYLEEAADQIDAAICNGDCFMDEDNRIALEWLIKRWQDKLETWRERDLEEQMRLEIEHYKDLAEEVEIPTHVLYPCGTKHRTYWYKSDCSSGYFPAFDDGEAIDELERVFSKNRRPCKLYVVDYLGEKTLVYKIKRRTNGKR
jgi:hypothetical protein